MDDVGTDRKDDVAGTSRALARRARIQISTAGWCRLNGSHHLRREPEIHGTILSNSLASRSVGLRADDRRRQPRDGVFSGTQAAWLVRGIKNASSACPHTFAFDLAS